MEVRRWRKCPPSQNLPEALPPDQSRSDGANPGPRSAPERGAPSLSKQLRGAGGQAALPGPWATAPESPRTDREQTVPSHRCSEWEPVVPPAALRGGPADVGQARPPPSSQADRPKSQAAQPTQQGGPGSGWGPCSSRRPCARKAMPGGHGPPPCLAPSRFPPGAGAPVLMTVSSSTQ